MQQGNSTVLVKQGQVGSQDIFLQPGHNLNAGEVAPVDGTVETLAREGFLENVPLAIPVEEAPQTLQFGDNLGRLVDQYPGQLLVIDERAAPDGVVEVLFKGVLRVQHRVIAALDHSSATALAYLSLGGHHNPQLGVLPVGVQRRHQSCSAAADYQYVRL